jgi:TolB-like protein
MDKQSFVFGPFVFDLRQRILLRQGSPVSIGQKCAVLLEALLKAEGRAVTKSELLNAAWQTENIEESNLAVQIAALRKCLGKPKNGGEWIATVQRVGYQFVNWGAAAETPPRQVPVAASGPPADKPSVAVLPFVNLSSDPEQDYFSDGITADIITELTRWRRLSVQSRGASFQYRGGTPDIKQIAQELKVRYIVEGSVRRIVDRIRINVQLIDAVTGNQVWAEKFDRDLAEIFAVQDLVVRTIVGTLVGRVMASAVEHASRTPPASLLAYECVLRGNALPWSDPDGAAEATRLFAKAVEIDPGYGFAHAMLATMRYRNWLDDPGHSDLALLEAHDLAKRAVELDNNESTSFSILSQVCLLRRSFDLAVQYMQRSNELNPNNQWNTADMGIILSFTGQAEEALGCFKRAKEIDPYFDPPWYWSSLGQAYMVLRRYEEALAAFAHLPIVKYWVSALMAGCHARLLDMPRAGVHAARCLEARPDFSVSHFMSKEPYKDPADAAHLAESLHLAGLPA